MSDIKLRETTTISTQTVLNIRKFIGKSKDISLDEFGLQNVLDLEAALNAAVDQPSLEKIPLEKAIDEQKEESKDAEV
jgi:plasmid maintenance system antidote protein VapI